MVQQVCRIDFGIQFQTPQKEAANAAADWGVFFGIEFQSSKWYMQIRVTTGLSDKRMRRIFHILKGTFNLKKTGGRK